MSRLPAKSPFKLVFFGYADNGYGALKCLLDHNYLPRLVITTQSNSQPLINLAQQHNLTCLTAARENLPQIKPEIIGKSIDLIAIASFPYLLEQEIINSPHYGTINAHTAALPKYRGYHPLNWAIIKDEPSIGVTVHYVDNGMDTGNILAQRLFSIKNTDDINTIKRKANQIAARLLLSQVKRIDMHRCILPGIPQSDSKASFAPRRYPQDGYIKWRNNSRDIFNLVRALKTPYPPAFSFDSQNNKICITGSYLDSHPGTILAKFRNYYLISTGDGVILVHCDRSLTIGDRLH